jgi:hypothetical protein
MTRFITIDETIPTLAEIGIDMKLSQMKRAAEPDHNGLRRIPFFKDPIDGRLKIEKDTLIGLYQTLHSEALENCQWTVFRS